MKRVLMLLSVFAVLAAGAFAGGGKDADSAAAAGDKPTVMLVTDATGIDDKSFNAAAWRGIVAYYGDTVENPAGRGTYYDTITCQTQDMYIPTLKQVSDEGYDLILTTGFTFADALKEVSQLYPDQNYMIVDVATVSQPNVMEFLFTEEQGSFLVGVLARRLSITIQTTGANRIWRKRRQRTGMIQACMRYSRLPAEAATALSHRQKNTGFRAAMCGQSA